MSLATKIRNALGSPDSPESEQGEGHVPGAFPTDDMTGSNVATSGSQHNKLHKPNDPRGWSDTEKVPHGHTHTDSGVGLTDPAVVSNDRQTGPAVGGGYYESRDTTQPAAHKAPSDQPPLGAPSTLTATNFDEPHNAPPQAQNAESRLTNVHNQSGDFGSGTREHAPTDDGRTGGITAATAPYDPASDAAKETTNLPTTVQESSHGPSDTTPYWGDIPRGSGIYNTVTGHGSHEDESRNVKPTTSEEPATARGEHAPNAGQQRAFTLRPSANEEVAKLQDSNIKEGDKGFKHDSQPTGHSRTNEALEGAGLGAGAGFAAYELSQKQRDHDDQNRLDRQPVAQQYQQPSQDPEHQKGGILHRSHGDDKQARHEAPKETREEKSKPHKEEKESKIASIFHRDHKDEKQTKPEHTSEKEVKKHRNSDEEKRRREADEAALAAASTAYAMHPPSDRKEDRAKPVVGETERRAHTDTATSSEQPKEKKEGGKILGLFHRSHKDKDDKSSEEVAHESDKHPAHHKDDTAKREFAAAGTGAGAGYAASKLASKDHNEQKATSVPRDDKPTAPHTLDRNLEDHSKGAQYNVLPSGTTSGVDYKPHNQDLPQTENLRQAEKAPTVPPKDDSHRREVAAAGAGAGMGYAASKLAGKDSSAPQETKLPRRDAPTAGQPPLDRSSEDPSKGGMYNVLPSDTPSGVGGAKQERSNTAEPPLGRHSDDPSKGGMYNVLPSGTPSGVHRPGDDTDSPRRENDVRTSGAGAGTSAGAVAGAGAGAGVLGAGAAAYGTEKALERKPVEPKAIPPARQEEPITEKKEPTQKLETAKPTAAAAVVNEPKKVTHKCVKCGEENDITSYFKQ